MATIEQAESGTEPVDNPIAIIPYSRYKDIDGWSIGDYISINRGFNTAIFRVVGFFTPFEGALQEDGTFLQQPVPAEEQDENIRMGAGGRTRCYDLGSYVPDSFSCSASLSDLSEYLGIAPAKIDWKILNDPYACRVNSEFLSEYNLNVGDKIDVTSTISNQTEKYEIYDTFTGSIDEPLIRMSNQARERIGIGSRRTSTAEVSQNFTEWSWRIRNAVTSSPAINDTHGIRMSEAAKDRLEFQNIRNSNVSVDEWVNIEVSGQTEFYGIVGEDEFEVVRPIIRMGEVARDRLNFTLPQDGLVLQNSDVTEYPRDEERNRLNSFGEPLPIPKPFIKQAFAEWDEEIGNPLLTRFSENLAERIGVSEGDMVEITANLGGTQRTTPFRVSQTHSSDVALEVPRMGFWARQRLINSGQGETQPGRFFIEDIEPFTEPENAKYVGVSQSLSEWEWGDNEEIIALSPQIANELDLQPKRTGAEAIEGTTQNDEWSNVLAIHSRFYDRRAAYTFTIEQFEDPNYPVARLPFLGRERLNDQNRDDETDGVPRQFAVKLTTPVTTMRVQSKSEAQEKGHYYAEAVKNASTQSDKKVISTAPHGGLMEFGTDVEAKRVAEKLNCDYYTGSGYHEKNSGSFERWHITSTDISLTKGFPKLSQFSRDYAIAVSFQGFSRDYLLVGGRISFEERQRLAEVLREYVDTEKEIRAALPDDQQTSELFDGDAPDHYCARLCENGPNGLDGIVQLEQPYDIRENHAEQVATAVAKWIDEYLDLS